MSDSVFHARQHTTTDILLLRRRWTSRRLVWLVKKDSGKINQSMNHEHFGHPSPEHEELPTYVDSDIRRATLNVQQARSGFLKLWWIDPRLISGFYLQLRVII